jgi:hypothetical protein
MSTETRQERIAYTIEDAAIFSRQSVVLGAAQVRGDERDYAAMQACLCDREAIEAIPAAEINKAVVRAIHRGCLAFRGDV